MTQKLSGKVAVITGAGSEIGIGKEVAIAMAAEGAKIVVNDISIHKDGVRGADKVVDIIKKARGVAVSNYDSITTMDGSRNVIQSAISNFGHIDILVNTAGNFLFKPTVDTSEADWDSILNVHLKGTFGCTQAAIKEMIKAKTGGRIITITSIAAFPDSLGPGPAIAYSTAKAGVLGFTKALSLELERHKITVNSVSPQASTILFPIPGCVVNGVQTEGPEYIAPIILYLATDEAEKITGQIIYSRGGYLCVYAPPMQKPCGHHYLYKNGKWTLEELIEIMPRMIEY
jgi:NAD(P)-dependent dehydrogenase (short-subunit alcohol dehydrogenase family)